MGTIEQCQVTYAQVGYLLLTALSIYLFSIIIISLFDKGNDALKRNMDSFSLKYKLLKESLKMKDFAIGLAILFISLISYKNFPSEEIKGNNMYFNNSVVINCNTKQTIQVNSTENKVSFLSNQLSCYKS